MRIVVSNRVRIVESFIKCNRLTKAKDFVIQMTEDKHDWPLLSDAEIAFLKSVLEAHSIDDIDTSNL